jgi:hypothetical protein
LGTSGRKDFAELCGDFVIIISDQVSVDGHRDIRTRCLPESQIDGQNLTNVFDVIDFGGLFSGNATGPSRSVATRLTTSF